MFAVDSAVNLGNFLNRRKAIVSTAEYDKEKGAYVRQAAVGDPGGDGSSVLTLPGEDVWLNVTVEGFKSRAVALMASMYDATSHRRVPELNDVPVFQQHEDSPSDKSVVEFWLPAPPVAVSKYYVRVEVYRRGDGVLLAVADSRPVVATGG